MKFVTLSDKLYYYGLNYSSSTIYVFVYIKFGFLFWLDLIAYCIILSICEIT